MPVYQACADNPAGQFCQDPVGQPANTRLVQNLSRLVQRSLVLLAYLQGRRTELLAAEQKLRQQRLCYGPQPAGLSQVVSPVRPL